MSATPAIKITRAGVKAVARFVAARAVSTTISLIVHQNAAPGSRYQTASVHLGAMVLGEMVAGMTKQTVDDQVDFVADIITVTTSAAKAAQK